MKALLLGWPADAILALYYLILSILAAYGVHRLFLVGLYYRYRNRDTKRPPDPAVWPRVTVQLPIFNERYVVTRLIAAASRLDYPRERLEIQVLDDSTDDTPEIIARQVEELRSCGVPIVHLRRTDRSGFKAGALELGLNKTDNELIAVFDADFIPRPDFLRLTVPYFADPGLGMVQARWEHVNRDYSLLTRIQAIFLDGHFLLEHQVRNRSGRFFNFNGTAGIWRRRAIEEAGGWQHDTLTEDLDLSYRAQLAGWRFLFLPDVAVPAELPVDIRAFKSQQARWAKGSMQTARKLLRRILAAPLPLKVKCEAFIHLTNNLGYPLMVLLSVLIFPAMVVRRGGPVDLLLLIDLPLFLAATVSVMIFYLVSQRAVGRSPRGALKALVPLMGLGIGLALSNGAAVLGGLARGGGIFERTPKYRIEDRSDAWRGKLYQPLRNRGWWLEGLFALYFLVCCGLAFESGMWMSLPFLWLFLQGFGYMFVLGLPLPLTARSSRIATTGSPPSLLEGQPEP